MTNATNTAILALEMANQQLDLGWDEVDQDMYDSVDTRLDMIASLIKDAERACAKLAKQENETAENMEN